MCLPAGDGVWSSVWQGTSGKVRQKEEKDANFKEKKKTNPSTDVATSVTELHV